MSLIKKLFGSKPKPDADDVVQAQKARGAPAAGDMIRVFDDLGRMFEMPKAEWRTKVLLPNLVQKRNDPEGLSNLIVAALRDGFSADVLESARHLNTIDPQASRARNLLGVVFLQLGKFEDARRTLEPKDPSDTAEGYALTNLAKAYAGLGDSEKRDETLWQALRVDPNQDNGLLWFVAMAKESDPAKGELTALKQVAALPGSWRAQLWLARNALAQDDVAAAKLYYQEALSRMEPVPADALMQISGDLGNRGQLQLLLSMCEPIYDVKLHGIQVGNNLIKANIDLGRTQEARRHLDRLYAQQRPDWKSVLVDWDRRIGDAEKRFGPIEGPVNVQLASLDQPLFAYGKLGFEAVLPDKGSGAKRVVVLCGTAEPPGPKSDQVTVQRTDVLGQVTRSIPLLLAEELYLGSTARSRVLIPVAGRGGVALLGAPWNVDGLNKAGIDAEVLVLLHVDAKQEPWQLRFDVLSWPTGEELLKSSVSFSSADPLAGLQQTVEEFLVELHRSSGIAELSVESGLQRPTSANLAKYALGLDTALLIALANMPAMNESLWGERALIDALIDLAASAPENARCRLLLLNSIEKEGRRRPDVVREYSEKLELLHSRHPLAPGRAADLVRSAMETLRNQAKPH